MLPTSPKKIFAGFQFQYKKARHEIIHKISKAGKYSDLFNIYAKVTPRNIEIDIERLIPSIPSIKLKIFINQENNKMIIIICVIPVSS